jgi:flagellar basal-body rod modification protein FlgD
MIDSMQRAGLGNQDFMKLLTESLRNQNPLSPMEGTEFVAQLAQMSTLEQMQAMNASFQSLLKLQQLTQGAGLIGMRVAYADIDSGTTAEGVVSRLVVRDGKIHLDIEGREVPIDLVLGVSPGAPSPAPGT